jgi:hypothetical protein
MDPSFEHEEVGSTPEEIGLWIAQNIDYNYKRMRSPRVLHAMVKYKGEIYEYNGYKATKDGNPQQYYQKYYGITVDEYTFDEAITLARKYNTFQLPGETYTKKSGTCGDNSLLLMYFLWEHNKSSTMVVVEMKPT